MINTEKKENSTAELLKKFFEKKINDGWENKFLDNLQDDFTLLMDDFGLFVVENKGMIDDCPFDFNDAVDLVIKEVSSMKIECIKAHQNLLHQCASKNRMDSIIRGN